MSEIKDMKAYDNFLFTYLPNFYLPMIPGPLTDYFMINNFV